MSPSGGHSPWCEEAVGGKPEVIEKGAVPSSVRRLSLSCREELTRLLSFGFRLSKPLCRTPILTLRSTSTPPGFSTKAENSKMASLLGIYSSPTTAVFLAEKNTLKFPDSRAQVWTNVSSLSWRSINLFINKHSSVKSVGFTVLTIIYDSFDNLINIYYLNLLKVRK